jgi:Lipocalin-like domain
MMKSNKSTKAFFLAAVLVMAFVYGCKKNAPAPTYSIVGTWSVDSVNISKLVNGITVKDTTQYGQPGLVVYSFAANGYYTLAEGNISTTSGYIINGSNLALYDTSDQRDTWTYVTVVNLTANTMTLQDTFLYTNDTLILYKEFLTR